MIVPMSILGIAAREERMGAMSDGGRRYLGRTRRRTLLEVQCDMISYINLQWAKHGASALLANGHLSPRAKALSKSLPRASLSPPGCMAPPEYMHLNRIPKASTSPSSRYKRISRKLPGSSLLGSSHPSRGEGPAGSQHRRMACAGSILSKAHCGEQEQRRVAR